MSFPKIPRRTILSIAFLSCTFLGYVYTTPTSQKTQIEDKVWMRFEKTQLIEKEKSEQRGKEKVMGVTRRRGKKFYKFLATRN